MELNYVGIFFRWLHVISACVLVGSAFFFAMIVPFGTGRLDDQARESVMHRLRRGFKMIVHVTLLLFLVSGIYNAMNNWPLYKLHPAASHSLFGMHVLLGLGAVTLLMITLAGKSAAGHSNGRARIALVVLLLAIGLASALKSAREWTLKHPALTNFAAATTTQPS